MMIELQKATRQFLLDKIGMSSQDKMNIEEIKIITEEYLTATDSYVHNMIKIQNNIEK